MPQEKDLTSVEPIEIMGYFWTAMGILILAVSVFVNGNAYITRFQGVLTNLLAGGAMTLIGLWSIYRGRSNKRKKAENYTADSRKPVSSGNEKFQT